MLVRHRSALSALSALVLPLWLAQCGSDSGKRRAFGSDAGEGGEGGAEAASPLGGAPELGAAGAAGDGAFIGAGSPAGGVPNGGAPPASAGAPLQDAGAPSSAGGPSSAGAPGCSPPPELTPSVAVPTPALYWAFDDADLNVNVLEDQGPDNHDGTIVAGITTGATGLIGQAFQFDGMSGNVTATAAALKTNSITVSVWLNVAQHVSTGGVFFNLGHGTATFTGLAMEVRTTDEVMFVTEGGSAATELPVFGCLDFARWVHYAAVFDGVSLTLYRDGVDVYQVPSTYSTINWGTNGLTLGQHDFFNNRFYAGLLDELGVWSSALTPAEIEAVYAAGVTGTPLYE
jgi:hypothetical protein